jgi:hypothetical protein
MISIVWNLWENSRKTVWQKNIEACNTYKKRCFKGTIVSQEYDKGVVNILNTGHSFQLLEKDCLSSELLQIGDSIYKPSGTFALYVYKRAVLDSVIFIPCDFDCDIYKKEIKE